MSTASAYLTVRGIEIDVVYKDIRNLHVGVYPPLGRVRVAAPKWLDDEQVRLAVIRRLTWIKEQRRRLRDADRHSEREMVTGESHYIWGVRRRLKVVERPGRGHCELDGERLVLYVPEGADAVRRLNLLREWQRAQLRLALPPLIEQWQPRIERSVPAWSIRRMKTKWGSCNRDTGHLCFNLELAKKAPRCLEYIVVHEMAHLREPDHSRRFTQLMDALMPDWRHRRDELNGAPLGPEKWS